jgi:multiple sugar transport system substrate-binding protein
MSIDPAEPVPLYFQLKALLTEQILNGRYGPGERLPTEQELCERYGISRNPVHRAVSELAAEGVVLRRRRRGTFVNPHWFRRQSNVAEVRVIVPEGSWAAQIRAAVGESMRLNIVTVPLPSLHRTLTQAVGEGHGPDLAVLDSVWGAEFAQASFLLALEDLDGDWVRDVYEADFLPPFVSANRHDGATVAVQAEADVAGLWFRRSALDDVGAPPPVTWDDLFQAAQALRRASARPSVALPGGRRAGETTTYCLLALLAANDARVLGRDRVMLDTPGTVETLRFLRALVDAQIVSRDAADYEWNQAILMLARGTVAIAFGGSYDAQTLADEGGLAFQAVLDEFGFIPMPAGPRGRQATLAGGMAFAIFRQARHPDLAMQLLRRLTEPEALATAARATGQIPPRRSAVQAVAQDLPLLAETAAMLPSATLRPAIPTYPRISEQLQTMVEGVLLGRRRPAAAVAHTAELIAAITGWPRHGRRT